ncbi:hypothetical protein [Mesorhizobium sp. NZP2077]|uniref:hypothetical protein n=1 Tax=Mesorhizobium sp. NZP2077 TaxID=2483404 RepID=UPI001FEDF87A|nr:hypothetical protein [Mesorhizobium sp. NZP2077]
MPASLLTGRASVTVFTAEDASAWADLMAAVPAEIGDRLAALQKSPASPAWRNTATAAPRRS